MRIVLAPETVAPFTERVAVPLLVGLLGLAGVIVTAAVSAISGRWAQATNRRRDAYAAAVKTLVAWAEYPYRIRRRTSDHPDELTRLVGIGHDLQEQLRCHQTWITTESRWVAGIYREAMTAITAQVAPACNNAWAAEPITTGAGMNLGGWGPHDVLPSILRLQSAIACRFGWRRAASLLGLHPGILPKEVPTRSSSTCSKTAAVAAPLDQAPAWVRDLLGSEREEAAADAEQAALLERVRAGEPGIAVSFEELASQLGLDQDPPGAGPAE